MVLLLLANVRLGASLFSDGGCQGASQCPLRAWRPQAWPPFASQTALWAERPHRDLSGCATAHLFASFSALRKKSLLRDATAASSQNVRRKATAGRGARAPYDGADTFQERGTQGRPLAAPTEGRSCNRARVRTFVRRDTNRYVPAAAGAWGRSPYLTSLGTAERRFPLGRRHPIMAMLTRVSTTSTRHKPS